MEHKVYEPKPLICKICNECQAVFLPICKNGNRLFWFPVCKGCRDQVVYEVVPITTEVDLGYFYCPEIGIDQKPILTNFGEKISENNNHVS